MRQIQTFQTERLGDRAFYWQRLAIFWLIIFFAPPYLKLNYNESFYKETCTETVFKNCFSHLLFMNWCKISWCSPATRCHSHKILPWYKVFRKIYPWINSSERGCRFSFCKRFVAVIKSNFADVWTNKTMDSSCYFSWALIACRFHGHHPLTTAGRLP